MGIAFANKILRKCCMHVTFLVTKTEFTGFPAAVISWRVLHSGWMTQTGALQFSHMCLLYNLHQPDFSPHLIKVPVCHQLLETGNSSQPEEVKQFVQAQAHMHAGKQLPAIFVYEPYLISFVQLQVGGNLILLGF